MAQVITLNFKRSAEVSKMTVYDYSHIVSGFQCIVDGALSEWDKALCGVVWRVEIVGKSSVLLLLTCYVHSTNEGSH